MTASRITQNGTEIKPENSPLVRTGPATWVTISPADSQAIAALAGPLAAELDRRFENGRPFETAAGALSGEEFLMRRGNVRASIGIGGTPMRVYLRLWTAHLDYGRLDLATRLGRGAYDVSYDLAGWLGQYLPERDRYVADLGYTDAELASPPTSEYQRMLEQELRRRREMALPVQVVRRKRIEEYLG